MSKTPPEMFKKPFNTVCRTGEPENTWKTYCDKTYCNGKYTQKKEIYKKIYKNIQKTIQKISSFGESGNWQCKLNLKLEVKACVRYFLTNFSLSRNFSSSKTVKDVFYFI